MAHVQAVIIGLLVLGVVVGEIEAKTICCPINTKCYKKCAGSDSCYQSCSCYFVRATYPCQLGYFDIGKPAGNGMSSYCRLGCTSSVCERITAGFKAGIAVGASGETEVKKAVQHCNNACSQICNIKDSKLELAAAA